MANNGETKQNEGGPGNESIKLKPKGKGKKALNKLNAINEKIDAIKRQIENIHNTLNDIIESSENFEKIDGMQLKPLNPNSNKKRSMVKDIPERIEFEFKNLDFYIEFTVVASTRDDPTDLKGIIIYGTNRTLCFTECIFPNKRNGNECENCERITRCDRLEDKPLLLFTVNQYGLIKSSGEIDDEWWIENEDLLDLHLRALEFIWVRALEWTNENLLP